MANHRRGKSLDDSSSNEQGIPFISAFCFIQMLSYVAPLRHLVKKTHYLPLAGEK